MLEGLYAGALEDSNLRAKSVSSAQLEQVISELSPPIDAHLALGPGPKIKIVAEIKRASPSKGSLSEITDVAQLASTYASAGASAISILTEQRGFRGSLADLEVARKRVDIALLRKDFISNEYQILEARAFGADMILLIAAGLSFETLERLAVFAKELGLAVLMETHNEREVRIALDLGCRIIGINARDLSTFDTDRDLFAKLSHLLPEDTIKVAESAVRDVEDVRRYRAAGADVVLVGEALVTGDAAELLREFTSV